MDLIGSLLKTLIKTILLLCCGLTVLVFAPTIPPDIHFEPFLLTAPRPQEGSLAPNSILDKAEPLIINKEILGPESIAVRGEEIFTGIKYGEIIKIKEGQVTTVAKTGKACEGYWDEKICGRPLGMRFDGQGKLVVADAYYGIVRVDVDTGYIETLISMDEVIDGKTPTFPNDVDIDSAGNIYWSIVSTNGGIDLATVEALGEPSGRLMKYDVANNKSEVLLDKIHFANGIQLSENEDFVMISELMRARILRYFLKGPRKGQYEVFVDGLPGLPDNIRPNGRGGYYIPLFQLRLPNTFSLPDVLGGRPWLRKLILRVQYGLLSITEVMKLFTGSGVFLEQTKFWISSLGIDNMNLKNYPKEVIIVEIDKDGNVIGSLQNQKGKITVISEVNVGPNITYFASAVNKQIWKMHTKDLHQA